MIAAVPRLCMWLLAFALVYSAYGQPTIIPLPQVYEDLEGVLQLGSLRSIVLGEKTESGDLQAAELLREEFQNIGVDVSIDYEGPETRSVGSVWIRTAAAAHPEGYTVRITPSRIEITAATETGRFYGAVTVVQLLRGARRTIPAVHIEDQPELSRRGVFDDLVAEGSTLDDFRRVIRFLGEHKMNLYVVPVERVFPFSAYGTDLPEGVIPLEEWRALQQYADTYRVDVVPALRTLTHLDSLLGVSRHTRLASFPGASSIDPADSASYPLLATLLDDLEQAFQSDWIHLGGALDRAYGVADSPRSRQLRAHYQRLVGMAHRRGKQVFLDADVVSELPADSVLKTFPEVVLVDRQATAAAPFPSVSLYRRSAGVMVGPDVTREGALMPQNGPSWANLSILSRFASRTGADGLLAYGWSEPDAPTFRALRFRVYAYAAEAAWNPDGASGGTIGLRFDRLFYGDDAARVRNLENRVSGFTGGILYPFLWRDPLSRAGMAQVQLPDTPGWPAAITVAPSRTSPDLLLEQIESLQQRLIRNGDQLDYLAFNVRFTAWLQEATSLAEQVRANGGILASRTPTPPTDAVPNPEAGSPERSKVDRERAAGMSRSLAREGRALAQSFRLLRQRTDRDASPSPVNQRMRYQVAYLETLAEALETNANLLRQPGAFLKTGAVTYLRTAFQLERGQVQEAHLQVAAGGEVALWINDDPIGRAVSDRPVHVYVRDVASQLQSGLNVLAVRLTRGDAAIGASVYLEIEFTDGRRRVITSNPNWKSTPLAPPRWYDDAFDDRTWKPAELVVNPPYLSPPLFGAGLSSQTDFTPPEPR